MAARTQQPSNPHRIASRRGGWAALALCLAGGLCLCGCPMSRDDPAIYRCYKAADCFAGEWCDRPTGAGPGVSGTCRKLGKDQGPPDDFWLPENFLQEAGTDADLGPGDGGPDGTAVDGTAGDGGPDLAPPDAAGDA